MWNTGDIMKKVLITGAAGFIGANLALKLLADTEVVRVIGIDNLNAYYDISIKKYRLRKIYDQSRRVNMRGIDETDCLYVCTIGLDIYQGRYCRSAICESNI